MSSHPQLPGSDDDLVRAGQLRSLATALRLAGEVVADSPHALSVVSRSARVGGFFQATVPAADADPAAVIAQARDVAERSALPQFIWTSAGSALSVACWQAGLGQAPSLAAMALTLAEQASDPGPDPLASPDTPSVSQATGLALVSTGADAEAFRSVHLDQFAQSTSPADTVAHFARDQVLLHESVRAVVAFDRGRPVSAGYAVLDGSIAGIYWVATHSAARRRGWGAQVMDALLAQLTERGVHQVLLQATTMGRPLYRGLGFTDQGLLEKWVVDPETSAN